MTGALSAEISGEQYELKNQNARDISRYDFVKDIWRLEEVVSTYSDTAGFAVLLTNDASYWQPSKKKDAIDADFRLNEGQTLKDTLRWSSRAGAGTTEGRTSELALKGAYQLNWRNYSSVTASANNVFRYLLIHIAKTGFELLEKSP